MLNERVDFLKSICDDEEIIREVVEAAERVELVKNVDRVKSIYRLPVNTYEGYRNI